MAIVLRLTKGSQLTFAELDGNFSDLDGRVTTNTNSINTINASISTLNTNVTGNDSDILSLQTDQNAIDTRLIAAEGELANVAMTSTEADFGRLGEATGGDKSRLGQTWAPQGQIQADSDRLRPSPRQIWAD